MNSFITLENRRDARDNLNEPLRYQQILGILDNHPEGMTARELVTEMLEQGIIKYFDLNIVRPRLTELARQKRVIEADKRKDMVTGKMNCVYRRNEVENEQTNQGIH